MSYKVGHMIRIKKDLVVGEMYGDDNFNEDMIEYRGKLLTICEVIPYLDGFVYVCNECPNWVFTKEMIDYVIEVPRYMYNKFEKVSDAQYITDITGYALTDEELDAETMEGLQEELYEIKLPQRKTEFSAGYDFHMPCSFTLYPHDTLTIPTGVRCYLENDKVLQIYPRSGLAFKYGMHLANGVGIIDADYVYADNEGHIMIKLVNPSDKEIDFEKGDAFAQGIITQYFKTVDDNTTTLRTGGMGSTSK
jgi:dUTP pyrophosphatase